MICPKCYQDILDNTFCPFCGYELSEENLKKLKESTIKAIPQINNFPFSATGRIERFPYILTNLIAIFVLLIGESIIKHYSSIQQSILLHYAHAALLILFYLVKKGTLLVAAKRQILLS